MSVENAVIFWCSVLYLCVMVLDFIIKDEELEHFIKPYYIGAMLVAYIIKYA